MSRGDEESEIEASRAPLLDHLTELRSRLIATVIALFLTFGVAFFFSTPILAFLTHPLVVANGLMSLQSQRCLDREQSPPETWN